MLNRRNDKNIIIISNGKTSQGSADRGAQFDTNLSESTLTPMASKSHSAFDYNSLEIFYSDIDEPSDTHWPGNFQLHRSSEFYLQWLNFTIGGYGNC